MADVRRSVGRPSSSSRSLFDLRVRRFLAGLHARLARGGRCFVSGAFVLEVPGGSTRFQRFLSELTASSTRRPLARTHDTHQSAAKLARRRTCGAGCAAPVRGLASGPQMEYRLSPPMEGLCAPGFPKGVLLWYVFSLGRRRYVFAKLETQGALSLGHATSALRRYVFKAPKQKSALRVRREDAFKNSATQSPAALRRAATDAAAENVAALWPAQAAAAGRYDATLRTGLEVFVPAAVVLSLV